LKYKKIKLYFLTNRTLSFVLFTTRADNQLQRTIKEQKAHLLDRRSFFELLVTSNKPLKPALLLAETHNKHETVSHSTGHKSDTSKPESSDHIC